MKYHGVPVRIIEQHLGVLHDSLKASSDLATKSFGISPASWQQMLDSYETAYLDIFVDRPTCTAEFVARLHESHLLTKMAVMEPLVHFMGEHDSQHDLLCSSIRRWGGFEGHQNLNDQGTALVQRLWETCGDLLKTTVKTADLPRRYSVYYIQDADEIEDRPKRISWDSLALMVEQEEEGLSESYYPNALRLLRATVQAHRLDERDLVRLVAQIPTKYGQRPAVFATTEGIAKLTKVLAPKRVTFTPMPDLVGKTVVLN